MTKSTLHGLCVALLLVAFTNKLPAETRKTEAASYVEQGDKFAQGGDFERAVGAYNIALQFEPDFAPAYFRRGLAQQARGDFSRAIADFDRAIKINSRQPEAYANRGLIRLQQGKKMEAEQDFARAIALRPSLKPFIERRTSEITQQ